MKPVLTAIIAFRDALMAKTGETPTSITLPRRLFFALADELSRDVKYEADGMFPGEPMIVLEGRLMVKCDELLKWDGWRTQPESADG